MDDVTFYDVPNAEGFETRAKKLDGSHDQRVSYTDGAGRRVDCIITAELGLPRDAAGRWQRVEG